MSVDQYQRTINGLDKEIADLEKQTRQTSSMANMLITNSLSENSVIPRDIERLRKEVIELQRK